MKKDAQIINFNGVVDLTINARDSIAWKLSMLLEAALSKDITIEEIARKYNYTREHFHVIYRKYKEGGSIALADKPQGPKRNYKRTEEVSKQIIRHRFLDPEASCEVIAQKMRQAGYDISQRSVERTIQSYGLQKKGYIKQIRRLRRKR
jgi:transposase-like protein